MQPIRNQILVKPFPSDEISEGGIFVPESCREVSNKVEVVAVGSGTKESPMRYQNGDVCIRIKDAGTEVFINGELHFLLQQDWILARLN